MTSETTSTSSGRIMLLVGNPKPESRTLRVGRTVSNRLARILGCETVEITDLAELAPHVFDSAHTQLGLALSRTADADLLVIATPIYKASYTGLLKAFLDQLAPNALCNTIAVPLIVSATPAHASAGEMHLRPLLVELGATVPTRTITVAQGEAGDPSALIDSWLDGAATPLLRAWSGKVHARTRKDLCTASLTGAFTPLPSAGAR